jgi:Tol biopolymer transport system component
MMKRLLLIAAFAVSITTAQANDLFGFLDTVTHKQVKAPTDQAELVTLEPKENEMYPKVSPDGRYLLVLTGKHKSYWISRRAAENGDPLNTVTDDLAALASVAWHGNQVSFLSSRTGMLGLWEKPADGEGLMRRVQELTGKLKDVTLLADGSIIATRLIMHSRDKHMSKKHTDNFNNWDVDGTHAYIVRIAQDGTEKRLSEGSNPAVSPDGKMVVFSMPIGRSVHLFMMNIDGSGLVELTDARSVDVQPTWSPDGKWIVFTSNRAYHALRSGKKNLWDIWAITSEGKKLTQLTYDMARDGAPSVAPNGYVYFHSDRKITKALRAEHQVPGATGQFHIWRIKLAE